MDDICVKRVTVTEAGDTGARVHNYCVEWAQPGQWWPPAGWEPEDLPEPPKHASPENHGESTEKHCDALRVEIRERQRALEDAKRSLESDRRELEHTLDWTGKAEQEMEQARADRDAASAAAFQAAAAYFEANPDKRVDILVLDRKNLVGVNIDYWVKGGQEAGEAAKKYHTAEARYRELQQNWWHDAEPSQRAAQETLSRLEHAVASEAAILELLLVDQRNSGCR